LGWHLLVGAAANFDVRLGYRSTIRRRGRGRWSANNRRHHVVALDGKLGSRCRRPRARSSVGVECLRSTCRDWIVIRQRNQRLRGPVGVMLFMTAGNLLAGHFQIVVMTAIDRAIAMFFDLPTRRTVDNFACFDSCITGCASGNHAIGSALNVPSRVGL